jgi:hypothetical protein
MRLREVPETVGVVMSFPISITIYSRIPSW